MHETDPVASRQEAQAQQHAHHVRTGRVTLLRRHNLPSRSHLPISATDRKDAENDTVARGGVSMHIARSQIPLRLLRNDRMLRREALCILSFNSDSFRVISPIKNMIGHFVRGISSESASSLKVIN